MTFEADEGFSNAEFETHAASTRLPANAIAIGAGFMDGSNGAKAAEVSRSWLGVIRLEPAV